MPILQATAPLNASAPGTYCRVQRLLLAAGLVEGRRRDNDRHGYTREPAVAGFVVATKADFGPGTLDYQRRVMVDHQGKGQAAAVARYAEILKAAGVQVELRPRHEGQKKLVVWVME